MAKDIYEKRGVSASKTDVHDAVKHLEKGLFPNAFCKVLPDYLGGDADWCNLLHTDTAGTKPILAYLYWKETGDLDVWKGIVQDAMVMNLDDMAVAGVTDGFVVSSNIARNAARIPGGVLSAVILGAEEFLQGLRDQGIDAYLAGGETADVGDLVRTIDVGYTVAARAKRSHILEIDIQPDDVIVGFSSAGQATYEHRYNSGIGCNGLTSARHDLLSNQYAEAHPESYEPTLPPEVVYNGQYRLTDKVEVGDGVALPIGQLLLSPTRTYLPLLKQLLTTHREHIHGIIHNTGGGLTKVLNFISDLHIIKDNPLTIPPIFRHIQPAVPTPWQEMYKTFNMGQRLEVYTDEKTAAEFISTAAEFGIDAQIIGRCIEAEGERAVYVVHEGETFEYTT